MHNATALNVVGILYGTVQGVPKDPREAVIWYATANPPTSGTPQGYSDLGRATYNGKLHAPLPRAGSRDVRAGAPPTRAMPTPQLTVG